MSIQQPIIFGKYILLERINVGGMAEVYKAKVRGVEGFEKIMAIKRILPNLSDDKEFIQMFVDEAKIAGQLNHANIGQIYDLGYVGKSYFIAMEYIHGKDVRALFNKGRKRKEKLPITTCCYIAQKVADGLDYAHRKSDSMGLPLNIVHRDISPQNILVSYEGEAKIIDFGIAKAATKVTKTQAGILKGKFGYMSPEQVRGLPLDGRSDLFSLGIIFYEILTGERLFGGDNEFNTIEKIRNAEIPPPSSFNPEIPQMLDDICLKSLARDIDIRYQSTQQFSRALQKFMVHQNLISSPSDLAQTVKSYFAREMNMENKRLQEYAKMDFSELTSSGTNRPKTNVQPSYRPMDKQYTRATDPGKGYRIHEDPVENSGFTGALSEAVDDYLSFLPASFRKTFAFILASFLFLTGALIFLRVSAPEDTNNGKMAFFVKPSNAEIWIDGKLRGRESPLEVELGAGIHKLEVSSLNYRRQEIDFEVERAKKKVMNIVLLEDKLIQVKIVSAPLGAEVYIKSDLENPNAHFEPIGTTPTTNQLLNGKKIAVKIIKNGFLSFDKEYLISEENKYITAKLSPKFAVIKVNTRPIGAQVFINKKMECVSPCEIKKLDPKGRFKMVIFKPGFKKFITSVLFSEGNFKDFNVVLKRR